MNKLCAYCAAGPREAFGRIFVRGHSLNDPGYWAQWGRATCEIGPKPRTLAQRDADNLDSQINAYYGGHNLF